MTVDIQTIHFHVPGCQTRLTFSRTKDGRLLTVGTGERVYMDATADHRVNYDAGFVTVEQTELPGGLLRRVSAPHGAWTESYRWDAQGRLVHVDGVDIRYDEQGRVVACLEGQARWYYAYSGPHLTTLDSPCGVRHVLRGEDGRACGFRERDRHASIAYNDRGERLPTRSLPTNWHLDAVGRLWATSDEYGQITTTYLWDGWHCLGSLAGEPGSPMDRVFSLDPTGTPVRIITRDGGVRVPRDAFGEGLLVHPGVPGLFGGAVCDGLVHLPYRRLDPLTGSFDSPDPMDGERTDPRRMSGWTGPLPIELPASGPYTVCRNNPVTLADPTGAISDLWWMIPSALTWSMQNTVGSLLGMWFNLEFSPLGWIVSAAVGADPFDAEWISANNFGAFGLRADGWISRLQPVAWTYQFLVHEEKASFTALEDARLFAPDSAFEPTLYGTVLRVAPETSPGFVLRGQRTSPNGAAALDWSRCGGTAQPAMPGSRVPSFPSGGLHFSLVPRGVRKQRAELVEVEPSGIITGSALDLTVLSIPETGLDLATDGHVLVTDLSGASVVAKVVAATEANDATTVRIDAAQTTLADGVLRVEGLTASAGTETLTPVSDNARLLGVSGSSNDYEVDKSVVRLSRAGAAEHAAKVTGLQAQLALDAPVPAGVGAEFEIRLATATGNFSASLSSASELEVTSGAVPGTGAGVLVGTGAAAIPAVVRATSGQRVTLDRDVSALGGAGTAVTWQLLSPGQKLGKRSGPPEVDPWVTYTPEAPGAAPSSGFVSIEGERSVMRRVTSLTLDALVLNQPAPDPSVPYSVERFRLTSPDVGGVTRSQAIALTTAPPANATTFHVVTLPGTTLTAGTVLLGAAVLSGSNASASVNPGAGAGVRVGEVVVVTPAGADPVAAVIRQLRLTVTLRRAVSTASDSLQVVPLAAGAPTYSAVRVGDRTLRVRPIAVTGTGTSTARVDMPRFVAGDLVQVRWLPEALARERLYRVTSVAGTTITCGDDEAAIPDTVTDVIVRRLDIADPETGSARLGVNGRRVSGTQIEVSAWEADDYPDGLPGYPDGRLLGIVDGGTVFPVRVSDAAQPLTLELALSTPADGTVSVAAAPAGTTSVFTANFTVDGATLTFQSSDVGVSSAAFVVAVPYIDTARRVNGELHPGTVRVPDDHENTSMALTRRQALEDHELTHTLQSARLGPLMLVVFPLWAVELATDLTAAGGPAFSPYQQGQLTTDALQLSNIAGFEAEQYVQVAQNRRSVIVKLGPALGNGFRLADQAREALGNAGIRIGPVQLRRAIDEGVQGQDVLEWITNIGQILTIGGLMNILSLAGWGGFAAVIVQIVQAIRKAARSGITVPIGSDHRTLTLGAGQTLDDLAAGARVALKSGDQIYIRSVESMTGQTVLLGQAVPLSGNVELSIYSPGAAVFGLRSYYPAAVEDVNRPARLLVQSVGGSSLSPSVHDRVEVRSASGSAFRTLVTAVDGAVVELETPALTRDDQPNEFLIAKIAEEDPTGWIDQWMLNELHLGWMQYAHDPWGQILYRAQPSRDDTAAQIFARAARYLFGTQSWMFCGLGFFWNDNAYRRDKAHLSRMEQEASRKSGDTYCPLGSLHGELAVVGDVARYWFTGNGGTRDGFNNTPADFVRLSNQDAPAVHLDQVVTVTLPTGSAFSTAGDFHQVDAAGAVTGVSPRGFIPADAKLERSVGMLVGFSKPPAAGGSYRVTGRRGVSIDQDDIDAAVEAQNDGAATMFFDRAPLDVTVTAAGVTVAEGTPPLKVIPFQRTEFLVQPNGARVYRATVAGEGTTFDVDGLRVTAGSTPVRDDVELSRFHRFDAEAQTFDSGIGQVHLPADIHIGVRRFEMEVVDTVRLRVAADHTSKEITEVRPGDLGFLLIPAPIAPVPFATTVTGTPSLAPLLDTPTEPLGSNVQAYLGDGGVLRVTFPANQPPEGPATVTITVAVGSAAPGVPVRCPVSVTPHFTLERVGGGLPEVARGGSVVLAASDATTLAVDAAPPGGVTLSPAGNQVTVGVPAGFGPGAVTVLVRDAANAQRFAARTLSVV